MGVNKKLMGLLAGLVMYGLSAPMAHVAMAVTFDFASTEYKEHWGVDFSSDGINVRAEGYTEYGWERLVTQSLYGLGVYYYTDTWNDSSKQIDGKGANEYLRLTFDQEVILKSTSFTAVWYDDDFTLLVDGITILDDILPPVNTSYPPVGIIPYDFIGYRGRVFDFLADGEDDDFYIKSVEVAPVPEPATLALMGLGLAGLGFTRHKKA